MMATYEPFTATCERVRRNDGMNDLFFVRRSTGPTAQESLVIANVPVEYGEFEEGKEYWVQFQPAFPRRLNADGESFMRRIARYVICVASRRPPWGVSSQT